MNGDERLLNTIYASPYLSSAIRSDMKGKKTPILSKKNLSALSACNSTNNLIDWKAADVRSAHAGSILLTECYLRATKAGSMYLQGKGNINKPRRGNGR